jgi:hypothetical protein
VLLEGVDLERLLDELDRFSGVDGSWRINGRDTSGS